MLLNISTSELALRLGVSQSTVVRLEQSEAKGTISLHSLSRMAKALGCKVSIFFQAPKPIRKKEYHGMQRVRAAKVGKKSQISKIMKLEEEKLVRSLSKEERILRSLSLCDFASRFR